MKNYVITSGQFTKAGNFTGYTALGVRLHFHKAQMASSGWSAEKQPTFPFYAVGETKKIGQLDENGAPKMENGVPVLVDRLTATSAFATKQGLIDARVDEKSIDFEISGAVSVKAKALGLSEEAINALESASV